MPLKRKLVAAGNCSKICSVSYLLQHSKINLDCSENDLKNLSELDEEKRQNLDKALNRKLGDEKNVCNTHLLALTSNLKRLGDCLAEYHEGSKRLSTKRKNNAHTVGKELCEHIGKSNGFLLPVGAFMCHTCYKDLNKTNPMPKKKKPEPPKPILKQKS